MHIRIEWGDFVECRRNVCVSFEHQNRFSVVPVGITAFWEFVCPTFHVACVWGADEDLEAKFSTSLVKQISSCYQ